MLAQVVAKVLGFDNRWGRWEVDHCNGRSGESSVGQAVSAKAQELAETWLAAALERPLKPTAQQIQAIRRDLIEAVNYRLGRIIEDRAALIAAEIAEKVLTDEVSSDHLG